MDRRALTAILVALSLPSLAGCAGGTASPPLASSPPSPVTPPPPPTSTTSALPPSKDGANSSGFGLSLGYQKTSSGEVVFEAQPLKVYPLLQVLPDVYYVTFQMSGATVPPSKSSTGDPRFTIPDGSAQGLVIRRGSASGNDGDSVAFYADNRQGVSDEPGVLTYQTFGYWREAGSVLGGFSTGKASAQTAVPTSGSATYSGKLLGAYAPDGSVTFREVASTVTLGVDFARGSVTFNSPDWRDVDTVYAGTALSGTLTLQSGKNALDGTLTTSNGKMSGPTWAQFYGPDASELGGAFVLQPANGGTDRMFGGFGTRR